MIQRPRLKANITAKVVDGDRVFLIADDEHYLVRGAVPAAVLPLLDGLRTIAEIVGELTGRFPPAQVFAALRRYEVAGHLAEGLPDLSVGDLAFWDAQGVDPAQVVAGRVRPVTVLVGEGTDAAPVEQALRAAGIRLTGADPVANETATNAGTGGDPALVIAVVDDYLDPMLAELNRRQLAERRPWLLVKPGGLDPWLGPLILPRTTGCWACMAQRLTENRQVERYLAGKRGELVPLHRSRAMPAAGQQALAALLAIEVQRILAGGPATAIKGTMISLDLRSLRTTEHHLVRRPQCSACGDPRRTGQRSPKVELSPCPAVHTTDGGYRVQPPQATFDRLSRHISPYLGAITRLGQHAETGGGTTFSFTAGHNFAMVNDNMDLLRRNIRGQSGGKGRSEIQAKVSALCEAIERYSAVWRGNEPVLRARYDQLDPASALHMDDLQHFSPAQFAGRAEWNEDPRHRMHLVPDPFRTDVELDWSSAWSLTHDTQRLIPAGYVWYGHPDLTRHFFCVGDSNGAASGNTVEEATLQGFCEVVERDAVALWWYNRLRVPAFDLDSLDDSYVATLRDFYAGMDREVWALDLTSDLGIPTFAALSHRADEVEDIMIGFGAHPDPRIAAMRALTELNQFLPFINTRDAQGRTDYRTDDDETLAWCKGARLAAEPWLLPDPARPPSVLGDFSAPRSNDLADHVRDCVSQARSAGMEVLVIDQSQPDLDLCVVKVVVPGMRHFWRRLGPGRLYDVPVSQGWLATPTPEKDINAWNVFF